MNIEQEFNFNDPVQVVEVFRVPNHNGKATEYSAKASFLWENLEMVDEYAYPDDWERYKGEKYHITLRGHQPKLILGSFDSMVAHWTMFRNKYPIFVARPDENE